MEKAGRIAAVGLEIGLTRSHCIQAFLSQVVANLREFGAICRAAPLTAFLLLLPDQMLWNVHTIIENLNLPPRTRKYGQLANLSTSLRLLHGHRRAELR